MSGSSKKQVAQPQPVYKSIPMETVQPFMPGYENALAHQLAAGFGGAPQNYLNAFDQSYAPMQVPDYNDWLYSPIPAVKTEIK